MSTLSVLLVLACLNAPAQAPAVASPQSTPEIEAPRRYLTVASVRYAYFGRLALPAQGGGAPVTLESQFLRVKVIAGHYFKRTGTVVAGAVGYDLLRLGSDSAAGGVAASSLHHLSVRFALAQRIHRKWMLSVFAKPGVASDYRGFRTRDLQLSTGIAARFAYRPNLVFLFGALYNNGVFGHLVLPMLHIRYRWRWLRLHFLFPHRVELWVVPHRKLELGLVGGFTAGVFGVHHGSTQRALGDRISTLYVNIGLAARSFLYGGWYLSVDAGYVARYLNLFRQGRQTHSRLDFRGGYVSVSSGYLL